MTQENMVHIQEMFEKKTGVRLSRRRTAIRPVRRAVLIVAAVLCCLGVTALAASELLSRAFSIESTSEDTPAPLSYGAVDTVQDIKELCNGTLMQFFQSGGALDNEGTPEDVAAPLSEAQLLTIDRYTTEVNQSQTVGDTTITFQSVTAAAAVRDITVYCVFTVEAPEGAWTEIDNDDLNFVWLYSELEGTADADGNVQWLQIQDDPQGRPNVKTVVAAIQIMNQDSSGIHRLRVDLEDFRVSSQHPEGPQVIAPGLWRFETEVEIESGLSLVEEPVALCGGDMMLESLGLSPLGGSIVVRGDPFYSTEWLPERVIFSDGTSEVVYPHGGSLDIDTLRQWKGFTFAVPTDLTNAVAVEFADGTRIEIP